MTPHPTIVFGAAAFWNPENLEFAKQVLPALERLGVTHIDTARGYNESEAILGQLDAPKKFVIDTKIPGFAPKAQTREAVFAAEKASFGALKTDQVDVYYLHSPDTETPIAETLAAVNEIHKSGKFKRFGLSNFSPEQVQAVYDHAKSHGYVLPTVYQGNYNPVSRHIEEDLFPLLRKLNIAFYAYSPIAGGFLSKSVEEIKAGGQGRWDPNNFMGQLYHALYNRPKVVEGLQEWSNIAQEAGISRAELAYRYMAYHSALKAELGDAIIIGASKLEQLEQTVKSIENGPLPQPIVDRIEKVWQLVKSDAPRDNFELFKG